MNQCVERCYLSLRNLAYERHVTTREPADFAEAFALQPPVVARILAHDDVCASLEREL